LYDAPHKEARSGVQVQGNQIVIQSGVGTPSTINVIAFSPDSKLLAAGKDFGRIVLWNLADGKVLRIIESKQSIVSAVAISPGNGVLASAGSENHPKIVLWDLATGKQIRNFPVDRPTIQALNFSSDGNYLIVRENGAACVFDIKSGAQTELSGETLPVLGLDGTELLTRNASDFLLRSGPQLKPEQRFGAPAKTSWPLAIDPRQDLLVYADPTEKDSFFARSLKASSDREAEAMGLPRFNPSMGFFAAIVPNYRVVLGHMDGRLWGWNILTGKTCLSPVLYSEAGQLSPDGKMLAGAINNGIFSKSTAEPGVELWDVPELIKACGLGD
jgi:WD40 repeat protein